MERLLYLPGNSFSPTTIELLPNERSALAILRDHFEVEIFHHPWLKGGPPVEPGWQSYVELIRSRLSPGCHVFARPLSCPYVMLALDGNDRLKSFITMGFAPPRATLIALDSKLLADARDAATSSGMPLYQFTRYIRPRASENEIRELAAILESEIDRKTESAFDRSFNQVDLPALAPQVLVPTLYLEAAMQMVGMTDNTDLFVQLVPQATIVQLKRWAERTDESAGDELAAAILDFTQKLSGETELLTLLMVDIVESTRMALESGERAWAQSLAAFNGTVRRETARYGGREVDNAGDGFLLAFVAPGQALRAATAIRESLGGTGVAVRIGLNSGECQVVGGKPAGLPIHIAARVAQLAAPNEILVSHTVHGLLVGSSFEFETRGQHELKGVPGSWLVYAVEPAEH